MKRIVMRSQDKGRTCNEAFELFIKRCRAKNLAPDTIIDYTNKTEPFLAIYGGDMVNTVRVNTVDDFVLELQQNHNVNSVSVTSYIRSLRAFLYFCMDSGFMDSFKIRLPKSEKQLKETYTESELDALLKKPDIRKCTFSEFRTWAFENYLLGTGNRISTALNIRISDIDFENGYIRLGKTKNRKEQIIPLSRSLEGILREYLTIRGGESDDYLFCDTFGQQGSVKTFQTAIYRYNKKRGVSKTSAHAFRHSFAKSWVMHGGDPFRLMRILGHSDISVTRQYVDMFAPDLKKDFDTFNPLDRRLQTTKRISMR